MNYVPYRKLVIALYNAHKMDVIEALLEDITTAASLPAEMHSTRPSNNEKLVEYGGYLNFHFSQGQRNNSGLW